MGMYVRRNALKETSFIYIQNKFVSHVMYKPEWTSNLFDTFSSTLLLYI